MYEFGIFGGENGIKCAQIVPKKISKFIYL